MKPRRTTKSRSTKAISSWCLTTRVIGGMVKTSARNAEAGFLRLSLETTLEMELSQLWTMLQTHQYNGQNQERVKLIHHWKGSPRYHRLWQEEEEPRLALSTVETSSRSWDLTRSQCNAWHIWNHMSGARLVTVVSPFGTKRVGNW